MNNMQRFKDFIKKKNFLRKKKFKGKVMDKVYTGMANYINTPDNSPPTVGSFSDGSYPSQ